MEITKKQQILGMLAAATASVIFGLSFIFVKQSLDSVSAFTLLSWRFIFAFVGMTVCALFGIIKINFRHKNIMPLVLIALFQPVLYFTAETFGISLTTASESGTIMACIPLVTLGLSSVILKEPPTRLQSIGIVVSVIGVLLIVLVKGMSASFSPFGYLLLVIAMLSDSFYVVFSRKASQYTSAEKTYMMSILGMIVFTGCALVENGLAGTLGEWVRLPFVNTTFLMELLYLSVASQTIAFLLNNYSISVLGATRAASFAGFSTVVSVIAGIFVLSEDFTWMQGVGTVLVLVGVYAANRMPKNAQPLAETDITKLASEERELLQSDEKNE